MRRALCAGVLLAISVSAQPIGFDVVSIKRNLSGSDDDQVSIAPGGRLAARNVMIRELIREVYRIQNAQLTGGPEWLATERWDIQATGARAGNRSQMIDHVKTLLRERFALRVHTELRDAPHYALTLARGDRRPGPGLEPDTADCAALPLGDPSCAAIRRGGRLRMSAAPMSDVAFSLSRMLDRPVVDRTGLAGTYRFELTWDPNAGSPTRATADGVSLFTAVREQLGLSLEAQRGPVEFLVIDSAQRPVED